MFDGPVVIGAQRGAKRRTVAVESHAWRWQVEAGVIHHRSSDAMGGGERRVGQLRQAVSARGPEVVSQPQCVADFVHHRAEHRRLGKALGLGAVGVERRAGLQHLQPISQLLGTLLSVLAAQSGVVATREITILQRQLQAAGEFGVGHCRRSTQQFGPKTASRSGPVAVDQDVCIEDLAAARVDLAWADAIEAGLCAVDPSDRGDADVQRVEAGVVGLDTDDDGVLEADLLERQVPDLDGPQHRVAVFHRHRAVDPEGDRLDRL